MSYSSTKAGVVLKGNVNKKKSKRKTSSTEKSKAQSSSKTAKSSITRMISLRKAAVGIGKDKMVLLRRQGGKTFVNIRRYRWDKHFRSFATKTGILLTPEEWISLKEETSIFDEVARICRKTDYRKQSMRKKVVKQSK